MMRLTRSRITGIPYPLGIFSRQRYDSRRLDSFHKKAGAAMLVTIQYCVV
jgi:hypothetical protein